MADPKPPQTRYAFTLEAKLLADPIGETPTGYRVDIEYQTDRSQVFTRPVPYFDAWVNDNFETIYTLLKQDPFSGLNGANEGAETALLNEIAGDTLESKKERLHAYANLQPDGSHQYALDDATKTVIVRAIRNVRKLTGRDAQPADALARALGGWYGLDAALLSGNDWAVVRSDGVAEFSGRITLRSQDDDQGLVDLTIAGPVDFRGQIESSWTPSESSRPLPSPSEGFQTVLQAMETGALPSAAVVIAATFNAAGRAEDWAPKRMKRQADGFWKYQMLTKSQFLATGTTTFSTNRLNPITKVELDFYQLGLR